MLCIFLQYFLWMKYFNLAVSLVLLFFFRVLVMYFLRLSHSLNSTAFAASLGRHQTPRLAHINAFARHRNKWPDTDRFRHNEPDQFSEHHSAATNSTTSESFPCRETTASAESIVSVVDDNG
jgi:hypothetical protein